VHAVGRGFLPKPKIEKSEKINMYIIELKLPKKLKLTLAVFSFLTK